MARYKSPLNVITVRDTNNTYTARLDGISASSTAGHEQAARKLAAKMLCIPPEVVNVKLLADKTPNTYRYQVIY
jgi:hypothetical protein